MDQACGSMESVRDAFVSQDRQLLRRLYRRLWSAKIAAVTEVLRGIGRSPSMGSAHQR